MARKQRLSHLVFPVAGLLMMALPNFKMNKIKIDEVEPVRGVKINEVEPVKEIKIDEIKPVEEIKINEVKPVGEIKVDKIKSNKTKQIGSREIDTIKPAHVVGDDFMSQMKYLGETRQARRLERQSRLSEKQQILDMCEKEGMDQRELQMAMLCKEGERIYGRTSGEFKLTNNEKIKKAELQSRVAAGETLDIKELEEFAYYNNNTRAFYATIQEIDESKDKIKSKIRTAGEFLDTIYKDETGKKVINYSPNRREKETISIVDVVRLTANTGKKVTQVGVSLLSNRAIKMGQNGMFAKPIAEAFIQQGTETQAKMKLVDDEVYYAQLVDAALNGHERKNFKQTKKALSKERAEKLEIYHPKKEEQQEEDAIEASSGKVKETYKPVNIFDKGRIDPGTISAPWKEK